MGRRIRVAVSAALLIIAAAIDAQSMRSAIEQAIDQAYQDCFRDFDVGGRTFRLRIPFGENGERSEEGVFQQRIAFGGRADPARIWERIDSLLASGDFQDYSEALSRPGEKAVLLYIDTGSWTVSSDPEALARVTGVSYPGTRTEVLVISSELRVEDLYNYLYCVGAVGMDCAGFVYFIQESIARALGADLDQIVGRELKTSPGMASQVVGLWYFDPANGHADSVPDLVSRLRPGDILLFRGHRGEFRHSAVIQSVDLNRGVIRYFQDTDWAPQPERGVHESFVFFDPGTPSVSLGDPSVQWTQRVFPTFRGEPGLRYWRNDGDRYRTPWPTGHSLVVRLKAIEELIKDADPGYYAGG